MKKQVRSALAVGLVLLLALMAACSKIEQNKEEPGQSSEAGQSSSQSEEVQQSNEQGGYRFLAGTVALMPGASFSPEALPQAVQQAEIPSCAFEGLDEVYTYEAYEVTAHKEGDAMQVYAVYLLEPSVSTEEGVSLGDTKEQMIAAYSDAYTENGSEYIYAKGQTQLCFILQGEVIISIEYRMAA